MVDRSLTDRRGNTDRRSPHGAKRFLLIGNGPAALAKEMGQEIDDFDGMVVRFNNYTTGIWARNVGSRTDIWVTNANYPPYKDKHRARVFLSKRDDDATDATVAKLGATRIGKDAFSRASLEMGFHHPSSGAITAQWYLDMGKEVWLWGFDFLVERRDHHYNRDGGDRGPWHDEHSEWRYFTERLDSGAIRYLGWDREAEGSPAVRQPTPCGKDADLGWYREPAHDAWYRFLGSRCKGLSVLDVGAGMCKGMKTLRECGASPVYGYDVDGRLRGLDDNLCIAGSLACYGTDTVDVVACVDVIEHVVADMHLMAEMKRIARKFVFITTPNGYRSKAGNPCHCREYSIPQFCNVFQPTEVWSASPDGKVHRTLLLESTDGGYVDHSPEGPQNATAAPCGFLPSHIPLGTRFNQTVDGEEWGHICAFVNSGRLSDGV